MTLPDHETYMQLALAIARRALDKDEFPVGCVVAHAGRVVARGERINTQKSVPSELDHAEILALRQVEALDPAPDRDGMVLYATLEPCLMCYGAILISGIGTVVYAYEDAMGGGTRCNRTLLPALYRDNPINVVPGVCRRQSLVLFQDYFRRPHTAYWNDSLLAEYTLDQPN
ncbi:MAG: nucleoside deaminase [Desulfatitalea sp.]|nr:nucleoside deaminase [Desulfatitalea sp.]NNK01898.1 nucleoside deaminase [Desulfatitalea sp.]